MCSTSSTKLHCASSSTIFKRHERVSARPSRRPWASPADAVTLLPETALPSPVKPVGSTRRASCPNASSFFATEPVILERRLGGEAVKGQAMAKESRSASKDVKRAMEKRKVGTLKSGKSGKTVRSKKQAIAIGLSEARAK